VCTVGTRSWQAAVTYQAACLDAQHLQSCPHCHTPFGSQHSPAYNIRSAMDKQTTKPSVSTPAQFLLHLWLYWTSLGTVLFFTCCEIVSFWVSEFWRFLLHVLCFVFAYRFVCCQFRGGFLSFSFVYSLFCLCLAVCRLLIHCVDGKSVVVPSTKLLTGVYAILTSRT
jgi:hypothetical protein